MNIRRKLLKLLVFALTVMALISLFGFQYQDSIPPTDPLEITFDRYLDNHKVFRKLNVSRVNYPKKRVNILVIVSSAPQRSDRRENIRQTWWKDCVPTNEVCN